MRLSGNNSISLLYMEKLARKPSVDPVQERLRADKAAWNKRVSSFINDLIHFKKTMNGWPSKFFKERARITQPIPADPGTIIGSLAGDFQEIANRGNAIIQEQVDYSKNRRQKQPKAPQGQPNGGGPTAPTEQSQAPEAPATKPDLSQQIGKGLAASSHVEIIKLAIEFEEKYSLVSEASNPFSRFITRLFNPKIGFGEAARVRRLRMTMLDNCVKSYKSLKQLHREIVRSGKGTVISSHKLMATVWNYWNIVNRLFSTFKAMRLQPVGDAGGAIEAPELKEEREREARELGGEEPQPQEDATTNKGKAAVKIIADYKQSVSALSDNAPALQELSAIIDSIIAAPRNSRVAVIQKTDIVGAYQKVIKTLNAELGTSGTSLQEIVAQQANKTSATPDLAKEAQLRRWLGKTRHQILPGATSGPRLEIYKFISEIRLDLDAVMNLLEKGLDEVALTEAIAQVNRKMIVLRTMMRSLYYSEKPEEAPSPFF